MAHTWAGGLIHLQRHILAGDPHATLVRQQACALATPREGKCCFRLCWAWYTGSPIRRRPCSATRFQVLFRRQRNNSARGRSSRSLAEYCGARYVGTIESSSLSARGGGPRVRPVPSESLAASLRGGTLWPTNNSTSDQPAEWASEVPFSDRSLIAKPTGSFGVATSLTPGAGTRRDARRSMETSPTGQSA